MGAHKAYQFILIKVLPASLFGILCCTPSLLLLTVVRSKYLCCPIVQVRELTHREEVYCVPGTH